MAARKKTVRKRRGKGSNSNSPKSVKQTTKSSKKSKKEHIGYKVVLVINPTIYSPEKFGNVEYKPTSTNMKRLKYWWSERLPDIENIANPKVNVTDKDKLKITFDITRKEEDFKKLAIDNVLDPDDGGNYPVYFRIKDKNVEMIFKNELIGEEEYDLEARMIKGEQVSIKITDIKK